MSTRNRPLSPHLQIYRPQLTSVLSISHRASGVYLALGALVLVFWLAAAAAGPNCTPATIFRVIEAHEPSLLVDEFDSFQNAHEELRGILNSGHTRGPTC